MNERQKRLLEFLKAGDPGRYISKEEICNSLKELYPRNLENTTEHNSTAFSCLREDIKTLRESYDCEYVIISSSRGYKVARNASEKNDYLERYQKKALRMLKRYWNLTDKASKNYQLKFDDEGNVEMLEVYR